MPTPLPACAIVRFSSFVCGDEREPPAGVFGDRDAGRPSRGRKTIGGGLFGRLSVDPPLPAPVTSPRNMPRGHA